jgi:hypothetical protein
MAKAKGNNKYASPRFSLIAEDILYRNVIAFSVNPNKWPERSEEEKVKRLKIYLKSHNLELYLSTRVTNSTLYFAAGNMKNNNLEENARKQGQREGFYTRSWTALSLPEDEQLLQPFMVSRRVDDLFQFPERSESGWIYVIRDEHREAFYVGQTDATTPLVRLADHFFREYKLSDTLHDLRQYINQARHPDWTVDCIRPEHCEKLICKSYILPHEGNTIVLDEAFIARFREEIWHALTPPKRRERAENTLIALYLPKFNTSSNAVNAIIRVSS